MSPGALYQRLIAAEIDGHNQPDMRRVLGCERQRLAVAIDREVEARKRVRRAVEAPYPKRPEYAEAIASAEREHRVAVGRLDAVASEAEIVARLWGAL